MKDWDRTTYVLFGMYIMLNILVAIAVFGLLITGASGRP